MTEIFDTNQLRFIAILLQNPQVCAIFTTPELKAQAAEIQGKAAMGTEMSENGLVREPADRVS